MCYMVYIIYNIIYNMLLLIINIHSSLSISLLYISLQHIIIIHIELLIHTNIVVHLVYNMICTEYLCVLYQFNNRIIIIIIKSYLVTKLNYLAYNL